MSAGRTLLVLGAGGQVGRELTDLPAPSNWNIIGLSHMDLDIADRDAVARAINRFRPAVVANAAAYTAVDKAETESDRAFAINRDGPRHIASAAAAIDAAVVHISTDYVFDGNKQTPYEESDPVAPANVYGASKEAGEREVREANPRHVIIRTAWVFASHGQNFLRTMVRLAGERDVVRVVADQYGTPTAAADIANAILAIATRLDRVQAYGLYHLTYAGRTTWHGFASHIFADLSRRGMHVPALEAIATKDYPTPARRPPMSVLNCSKLAATFGISLRSWEGGVDETLRALLGNQRKL
jgi:dTDP-4-dehydrorhamnose reductase